jgi:hypothetical protein
VEPEQCGQMNFSLFPGVGNFSFSWYSDFAEGFKANICNSCYIVSDLDNKMIIRLDQFLKISVLASVTRKHDRFRHGWLGVLRS